MCIHCFISITFKTTQNHILGEGRGYWHVLYMLVLIFSFLPMMFPFLSYLVSLSSTLFLHFLSVSLFCFFTPHSLSCSSYDPLWDIFPWVVFFYLLSLLFDRTIFKWKVKQMLLCKCFREILPASGDLRKVLELGPEQRRTRLSKRMAVFCIK